MANESNDKLTPEAYYNMAVELIKSRTKANALLYKYITLAEQDETLFLACQIMRAFLYKIQGMYPESEEVVNYLQLAFIDRNYILRKQQRIGIERLGYLPKPILDKCTKGKIVNYESLILSLGGHIFRDKMTDPNSEEFIAQEIKHFFSRKEIMDMYEAEEKLMEQMNPEEMLFNQEILQSATDKLEDGDFKECLELCSKVILNPLDPKPKLQRDELMIEAMYLQGRPEDVVNFVNSSIDLKDNPRFLGKDEYMRSLFLTAKTSANYKEITEKLSVHANFQELIDLYIEHDKVKYLVPHVERMINSPHFKPLNAVMLFKGLLDKSERDKAELVLKACLYKFPRDFVTHSMVSAFFDSLTDEDWHEAFVDDDDFDSEISQEFLVEYLHFTAKLLSNAMHHLNLNEGEVTKYENNVLTFYIDGKKEVIEFNQAIAAIKEAYKQQIMKAEAYKIATLMLAHFGDIPDVDLAITTFMLNSLDVPTETKRAFLAFEFSRYRYQKDYIFSFDRIYIHVQRRMDTPKKILGTQYEFAYYLAIISLLEVYEINSTEYESIVYDLSEEINERFRAKDKVLSFYDLKLLANAFLAVACDDDDDDFMQEFKYDKKIRSMVKEYFLKSGGFGEEEEHEVSSHEAIKDYILTKIPEFDRVYEERNKVENFIPKLASIRFNSTKK